VTLGELFRHRRQTHAGGKTGSWDRAVATKLSVSLVRRAQRLVQAVTASIP